MNSVEHSIDHDEFEQIARSACGHSGCDIASLAREAAMIPVRELTATLDNKTLLGQGQGQGQGQGPQSSPVVLAPAQRLRAVTYEDFVQSLSVVTPSGRAAG
jgi:SpoVK/Ycf46/Vps4 family AAA+-type ATPase